jgi:alkylation response protein AidB-like acyl-CoA dehydrogenase
MSVSADRGGLGLSELDTVLIFEETGRVDLPGVIVETAAVGGPLLCEIDSQNINHVWLDRLVEGQLALSLASAPSEYLLDASLADLLIVRDVSGVYVVDPDSVHFETSLSVDHTRRLERIVCKPSEHLLLIEGDRAHVLMERSRQRGTLAVAAQLLGLADALLEKSVSYANVREQFGQPIGSFQALKHKLSNVLVDLEFARPMVYRAAYSMAEKHDGADLHVSMAKIYAGDVAHKAARTALQVHGAMGYSYEFELHLWMKRVWALMRSWGDGEWHRARIEENILD